MTYLRQAHSHPLETLMKPPKAIYMDLSSQPLPPRTILQLLKVVKAKGRERGRGRFLEREIFVPFASYEASLSLVNPLKLFRMCYLTFNSCFVARFESSNALILRRVVSNWGSVVWDTNFSIKISI